MKTTLSPRLRWSGICSAAVLFAWLALSAGEWWDWVGVMHMRPYFADLAAVFAAGEASVAGLNVYEPNPFDPFGRPHVYGPWWLVTGPLGFVTADAWWVGSGLALVFLLTSIALLAPRSGVEMVFCFLLLVSPPVLLAVERANNDLIVFVLLGLAATLVTASSRIKAFSGAVILIFAAALKFYPLAALVAWGARTESSRKIALIAVSCGAVFTGLWWLQREGFDEALAIAPRPQTIFAYGIGLFAKSWESFAAWRSWLILGYGLGLALSIAGFFSVRVEFWKALPSSGKETAQALAAIGAWLCCYLLNTNYPYRVVLLLLLMPWWMSMRRSDDGRVRKLGSRLCLGLLIALWLAAPKYWWAVNLMSEAVNSKMASRWLVTIVGVEQMLVFVLSGLLAVFFAGWAWRRWREGAGA